MCEQKLKGATKEVGLKEHAAAEIKNEPIEAISKSKLRRLLNKITRNNRRGEADWGKKEGGEVW